MSLRVRRSRPSDIEVIVAFNAAMADETEHLRLNLERLRRGVGKLFSDPSWGFYVVAESDGTVVGQMMITFEWSDWRNGTFWWIQSVYVLPNFRRKKIFTALYRYVEEEARRREDVCGLRLYVDGHNTAAQKTYERLGMSKTAYDLYEVDFVMGRKRSGTGQGSC